MCWLDKSAQGWLPRLLMTRYLIPVCLAFASVVSACGSSTPEPEHASSEISSDEGEQLVSKKPEGVPSQCVQRMGACMPPITWAESVCQEVYPDLALYMFRKGTPWTRYYMRTGLNAVNGWGPTVDEDLVFQEEVIVINHRLRKDALDVEGSAGTFDVIRWNGSCVTLDVNEVTPKQPRRPKHSRVDFRALGEAMQEALLNDETIKQTYRERRKECRGASIGRVTKRCEVLDGQLGDVIAEYVRESSELPLPSAAP